MKKTKIILTAMCFLAVGATTSQAQQTRHEIRLGAGGGISSLEYELTKGNHTMGWGGNFGLGYTFFINPQWGIGTGVEMALYRARATFPKMSSTQNGLTDSDGAEFTLLSDFDGIQEEQRATFLNIPVMVQFQTKNRHKFYAALGVKFGIPLKGKYEGSGSYDISGYYPQYSGPEGQFIVGPRAGELIPEEGFSSYKYDGTSRDLDLSLSIMGSVETGVKWQLNDRWALYTGLYLDYGFNDIYNGKTDQQLVTYDVAARENGFVNIAENSIIGSTYTENGKAAEFTDKLSTLSAGITIKVSFGAGKMIAERAKKTAEISPEGQAIIAAADKAAQAADKATQAADAQRAAADKVAQVAEQIAAADKAAREAQAKQAASDIHPKDLSVYNEVIDNYTTGTYTPLNDAQKAIADKKIDLLKKDPNSKVMLIGHTCNLGSKDANYKLGLQRADAVKAYMIEKGVSADRITTVSKGDTAPKYANDTDEHRRLNRRVEIIAYH